jgi:hypothetical protein
MVSRLVHAALWLGMAMPVCQVLQAQEHSKSPSIELPVQQGTADLCNEGGIICVSPSTANSLISNPFAVDVRVNSPDDIDVDWEIKDSTGKVLDSASTYDDINETGGEPPHKSDLRLRGFILQSATSDSGTLTLKPSRFSISTGKTDLPPLEIPVRLTTEKTTVTWLETEKPEALQGAVSEWIDSGVQAEFKPKLKLVPRHATIMRVEPDAIIGATAEAVLHFNKGQGEWFVTAWRRDGNTAHVTIHGEGWTGVTYYLMGVSYLIQESELALPGIKTFVFDQAE